MHSIFHPCFNRSSLTPLLAVFLSLVFASSPALGAGNDVSHLWRPRLPGPAAARGSQVVRNPCDYALIYRRGGLAPGKVIAEPADWLRARAAQEKIYAPNYAAGGGQDASKLESSITDYIRDLRQRGLISRNERTSWLIYDLSSDKKLVGINEDVPLQAASLIKPFVALAYFHEVGAGRKPYSAEVRRRMVRMIRDSDNSATNWLLRQLGGPAAVQDLLKNNYREIFGNTTIVEYIPAGGRTFRNKASANDYSRFLHALWNNTLPRSAEIKSLMNLPKPDRLTKAAPGVPRGTEVYGKTGTTSRLCGDMGILIARREGGGRFPYIIVGVIERERSTRSYTDWMHARGNIIRRVSGMAYKGIVALAAGTPR